jgi:protein-S-isoprenylcysteine O-methyltransferase Ste14
MVGFVPAVGLSPDAKGGTMVLLLKNLLFTVFVPGTVAGFVPWLLSREESLAWGAGAALALLLFATGGAIYFWCVWDFATFGRGTPAPIDAPKSLVVRGLYRYSRNPMYVGVLTTLLGWVVLFASLRLLVYSACVGVCFQLFIVYYEEPHLSKTFGRSYDEYRSQVGRWIPGIGRRSSA